MENVAQVSVLMLDIQGSTGLHEQVDDEGYLFSLIPTFHKFLDGKIAERTQGEPNRQGLGEFQKQLQRGDDCVKAVFATAQNAVACAVDIQNQFKQFPVAKDHDGKDIFLSLHLSIHSCSTMSDDWPRRSQISPLARLLKKANNGQVLLSPACYEDYMEDYAKLRRTIPFPCEKYGGYLFDGIPGEHYIYSLQYDNKYRGAPGVQFIGFENLEIADRYIKREAAEALVRDTFEKAIGERGGKIRFVTVCGEGGMGKTRLTINCARQMVGRFPGGIIFVPLADFNETKPTPDGIAAQISDALHFVRTSGVDIKDELMLRLQERDELTLLLLDNAETITPDTDTVDYLQELLQAAPCLYFLASSRTWFELDIEGQVDINNGLSPWESFRLFQERVRQGFILPGNVTESEINGLHERMLLGTDYALPHDAPATGREHDLFCLLQLFDLANHNTLALELIASWTSKYKEIDTLLTKYKADALSWFTRHGGRPSGKKDARNRHVSLEASYLWSWKNLGAEENGRDAQAAFLAAALFADTFTDEAIEAVLGWNDAGRTADATKAVQNASLFRSFAAPPKTRYRMHWQLQAFGRTEKYWQGSAEGESNLPALAFLRQNIVAYYDKKMEPFDWVQRLNSAESGAWLSEEWRNVVAAARYADKAEKWKEAVWLRLRLSDHFERTSNWHIWEETGREAYQASLKAEYIYEQAATLNNLGSVCQIVWKIEHAKELHEKALKLLEESDNLVGQSQTRINLGSLYLRQNKWNEAEAEYKAALATLEKCITEQEKYIAENKESEKAKLLMSGFLYTVGGTLLNLGDVYVNQGKWFEAEDLYEQAHHLMQRYGDLHSVGKVLHSMASLHELQGKFVESEAELNKAVVLFKEAGDLRSQGMALSGLGNVYQGQSRWAEATGVYLQDLAICEKLDDLHGQGQTLNNLGVAYRRQGEWDKAESAYQRSLILSEKFVDYRGQGQSLNNLGLLYEEQDRFFESEIAYQKSLAMLKEVGDVWGQAATLGNLAILWKKQNNLGKAAEYAREGIALIKQTEDTALLKQLQQTLDHCITKSTGSWFSRLFQRSKSNR